jgi:hypothetical protein
MGDTVSQLLRRVLYHTFDQVSGLLSIVFFFGDALTKLMLII